VPAPPAPPRQGGALRRPGGGSAWPIVIGTLSIVFGAGGFLAYGCFGTLGMAMLSFLQSWFEDLAETNPQFEVQAAQFAAMSGYTLPLLIQNAIAGVLGVLLLIGGIGVVSRRRYGVTTSLVWCILKVLYVFPAAWIGYTMSMAQFEAMEEAAVQQGVSNLGFGMLSTMGWVGSVIQLLWLLVWPVFMLIWFLRPKIRAETATWPRRIAQRPRA
jgi:hypothetical protein